MVGPSDDESILRLSGKYNWKINAGAVFDQSLIIEKGDANTYSESVTRTRPLAPTAVRKPGGTSRKPKWP